ncbi:MAG TPA: helix-turn-helix domain-containing protein [Streptosporangiaceae bacterium]|nr:helix-turn-helix domain-containing protein [Streptosporangiaceae bacterium]
MTTDDDWTPDEFWESPDPLLTVPEVCDWFKVGPRLVRRLLRTGQMDGHFLGGTNWLVETSAVIEYLEARTVPANPEQEGGPDGRLF